MVDRTYEDAAPVAAGAAETEQGHVNDATHNGTKEGCKPSSRLKLPLQPLIGAVAHRLRSDFFETPNLATTGILQFGSIENRKLLCVSTKEGHWWIHGDAFKGGLLDLIVRECGFIWKAEAIAWLRQEGFIPKDWGKHEGSGATAPIIMPFDELREFITLNINNKNAGILDCLEHHYVECSSPDPVFEIIRLQTSNLQYQIRAYCLKCKTSSNLVLPKKWFTEKQLAGLRLKPSGGYDPDGSLDECEHCHCLAFCERHHWAPRELFGVEADRWPTANLCQDCHVIWHQVMNGRRP
jgi:hypothetical protein